MKTCVTLLIFFILALALPPTVSATPIWDGWYSDCSHTCEGPPPNPSTCWNGPNINDSGGCGTACGGGQPWSRYEAQCKNFSKPEDFENCNYAWVRMGDVCSTGDKCIAGDTGLRAGNCNCGGVGGLYKTCCSGSTPVACQNYSVQDPFYPPEGTCGGARAVRCGGPGEPACGAAACAAPTATPGPSPTPGGGEGEGVLIRT